MVLKLSSFVAKLEKGIGRRGGGEKDGECEGGGGVSSRRERLCELNQIV